MYVVVMVKLMISLTRLIFHSDTSSRLGMKCYVECSLAGDETIYRCNPVNTHTHLEVWRDFSGFITKKKA